MAELWLLSLHLQMPISVDFMMIAMIAIIAVQPSPVGGLESCGCPGWQFPDGAFMSPLTTLSQEYRVDNYVAYTGDCEWCQSEESISLSNHRYLELGTLTYGDTDVTFTIWVFADSNQQHGRIFDFGSGAGTDNDILKFAPFSRTMEFYSVLGSVYLSDIEEIPLNTWVHLAVTIEGSTATLYRDGVARASGALLSRAAFSASRAYCKIGWNNYGDTGGQFWLGRLADFRMYKRALSATEVAKLRFGLFADDSSLFGFFRCYEYTHSCPKEDQCGCPGWQIPASALQGNASVASVADCTGCQSEEGVLLTGVADSFVDLGALTYDDASVTYAAWIYPDGVVDMSTVLDFGSGEASNNQVQLSPAQACIIRIIVGHLLPNDA